MGEVVSGRKRPDTTEIGSLGTGKKTEKKNKGGGGRGHHITSLTNTTHSANRSTEWEGGLAVDERVLQFRPEIEGNWPRRHGWKGNLHSRRRRRALATLFRLYRLLSFARRRFRNFGGGRLLCPEESH